MSEHSPTATRRSALAAALGVTGLSVAGCDLQDLDPREPVPATSAGSTGPADAANPDVDLALVAEVVALVLARSARVDAVRRRHPDLRRTFGPLARMHQAHLAVLDPDGAARDLFDAVVPATSRQARDRRRLIQAERTLCQQVARAAERAEAGQVAKLLASISASVAQHVAVIEESSP